MNASTNPHQSSPIVALRRRESATEAMIRQIDEKLSRLDAARHDRVAALNRIRCELVRAQKAESAAAEFYEK